MINQWLRDAGVTERPNISDSTDLRAGATYEDHRIGLFSILEEDELIGGFGAKYRAFTVEGPDNFPPDEGKPLEGLLQYGSVIRPDRRGRGRWLLVMMGMLRLTDHVGYYSITANEINDEGKPLYRLLHFMARGNAELRRPARGSPPATERQSTVPISNPDLLAPADDRAATKVARLLLWLIPSTGASRAVKLWQTWQNLIASLPIKKKPHSSTLGPEKRHI